jgi:hypothetical protein
VGKLGRKRQIARPRYRWEDNIKMDRHKVWCVVWTRSIWLGIGTGGRHLWMQQWNFRFHKMWGISWLARELLASQEGLCSMEYVIWGLSGLVLLGKRYWCHKFRDMRWAGLGSHMERNAGCFGKIWTEETAMNTRA